MKICTIGDLLLDVVVRLDEPLAPGADALALTRAGPGGQSANVAAWAVALGASARFVGKRADDPAGRIVTEQARALGVEVVGPVVAGRNGVVVSLVGRDGDRTMASDRGVATELRSDELEAGWFADCEVLHVSGYSLLATPIDGAAERAAALVRARGALVSVDLSAWTRLRDFGPARFRSRLELLAPDIVFANEDEWETLGGLEGARLVLKRGARGIVVDGQAFPAAPTEVADTTGAGDALAAGFLIGGPELALAAAARCVAQIGAMP